MRFFAVKRSGTRSTSIDEEGARGQGYSSVVGAYGVWNTRGEGRGRGMVTSPLGPPHAGLNGDICISKLSISTIFVFAPTITSPTFLHDSYKKCSAISYTPLMPIQPVPDDRAYEAINKIEKVTRKWKFLVLLDRSYQQQRRKVRA